MRKTPLETSPRPWGTTTITVTEATLTVTLAGSGSGAVNSDPSGLHCINGTCSSNFSLTATETLLATASGDSVFAGWSGSCSGSGNCLVPTNVAKAVTATYNLLLPVRLHRATPLYFATVQAAYDAAISGDVIQLKEGTLAGALNANRAIAVTIEGGYSASYGSVSSSTQLQGKVAMGLGSVVMEKTYLK